MEPLVYAQSSLSAAPAQAGGAVVPFPVMATMTTGTAARPRHDVAALFAAEESGLLRFALGVVRQRAVAEELVQETFLRFHQVAAEVENPRGWLYRSLRNLALNHLRDRPRETELPEEPAAPEATLPVEAMVREEAIGTMRLLLAELPDEDRDLIRMKYNDDLKYQEISRRTGLSVGNVGYRLHHALKALAAGLRRAGIERSEG